MPDQAYRVKGTHITSPYPLHLTPGEHRLIFTLEKFFTPEYILPDCYFPKPDQPNNQDGPNQPAYSNSAKRLHHSNQLASTVASTAALTQIDCLALHPSGLYIFESKDYNGWIYGDCEHRSWTEVLNFGREKHQFYNPVLQNSLHLTTIQNLLTDFSHLPLYSIIVFGRSATLKVVDHLPDHCHICTQAHLRTLLHQLTNQNFISGSDLKSLHELLEQSRINPDAIIRDQHITEASFAEHHRQHL